MTVSGYYIVIDFDGTVVKHRYPAIGEDIGALPGKNGAKPARKTA